MHDKARATDSEGIGELARPLYDLRVADTNWRRIVEHLGPVKIRHGIDITIRRVPYHARLGWAEDFDTQLDQAGLQPAREVVNRGQAGEVVRQRVCGRSGHEPGLAHPAAKHLPEPAGARDELLAADKAGADGRA